MIRLRFHAPWLPDEHKQFWTVIDKTKNLITINDLIEYFNEQQKLLGNYYQFYLSKRSTKIKYLKAFLNECVLPPNAQIEQILRDNDQIDFRLEIDAQTEWFLVKPPPTLKRKRSEETEPIPPSVTKADNLDTILRQIAQPEQEKSSGDKGFSFQFGNKRGRPIPPRPPVMSVAKVNSLIPRQVIKNKN